MAYQTRTFILLLFAGIAASVTMLLLLLGVADYGLKFKQQQQAFEAVDTVMTDVNLPYMRVDEDGHVSHMNDAAAKKLGFSGASTAIPILRKTTFEDLLADNDSSEQYQLVKEERAQGKKYRSYTVRLWSGGGPNSGSTTEFTVHGWNVPTPKVARGKPGQSFGILIPTDQIAEPSIVQMVATALELPAGSST